jgi:hypothetical protein
MRNLVKCHLDGSQSDLAMRPRSKAYLAVSILRETNLVDSSRQIQGIMSAYLPGPRSRNEASAELKQGQYRAHRRRSAYFPEIVAL